MVESLTFTDIQVTPYNEDIPWQVVGGPRWPDWDQQVAARLCRRGVPIGTEPRRWT